MAAYSPCFCRDKLRAVSLWKPPTYDYAGAFKAINPSLNRGCFQPIFLEKNDKKNENGGKHNDNK